MDFIGYVKEGIEIVKLNTKSISKIARDKKATKMAVVFFALGGVASAIGALCIPCIIILPIMMLVFTFIGVGFLHLLAKLFGGRASFAEFYRAYGIGSIITWVSVIPLIGGLLSLLASLWGLVITFFVLKTTHKLSSVKAAIVIAIPAIIGFILMVLFLAAIMAMIIAIGLGGLAGTEAFGQFTSCPFC